MNLKWLKRAKEKDDFPTEVNANLPDELERFRTRRMEPPAVTRENYARPLDYVEEEAAPVKETKLSHDKTDLILQKLETIDLRLKLLEEKLGV